MSQGSKGLDAVLRSVYMLSYEDVMRPTQPYSTRQPVWLQEAADRYAEEHGTDRTGLIRAMYEALAEGRLYVVPRPGPQPFPADHPLFPPPPQEERP